MWYTMQCRARGVMVLVAVVRSFLPVLLVRMPVGRVSLYLCFCTVSSMIASWICFAYLMATSALRLQYSVEYESNIERVSSFVLTKKKVKLVKY